MNTNSNAYTIIYSTIVVVVVAAALAFVAMTLKPKQEANIKAETISQMLSAAQFASKEDLTALGNENILKMYSEKIVNAFTIDAQGNKVRDLETQGSNIELADNLKAQNYNIKDGSSVELPVYVFEKDGRNVNVVPVYGAGLWGPVWGYIAFNADCSEIVGAYFDHDSETPGLGAKIKDEAWFREQFAGKRINFDNPDNPFNIVKGGVPQGEEGVSMVDAISGATMTCNGLDAAIDIWMKAYIPFLSAKAAAARETECNCGGEGCEEHSCGDTCTGNCTGAEEHSCTGSCTGTCTGTCGSSCGVTNTKAEEE